MTARDEIACPRCGALAYHGMWPPAGAAVEYVSALGPCRPRPTAVSCDRRSGCGWFEVEGFPLSQAFHRAWPHQRWVHDAGDEHRG